MSKELSLAEQLCYNTTRIETINTKGEKHIATGFFMGFRLEDGNNLPLLVTNRHVADDANQMKIFLTEKDANGDPIDNAIIGIIIENAKSSFIFHPYGDVDLAVIPIYQFIVDAEANTGKRLYYRNVPSDMLITDDKAKDLDAIEEVVMIGYQRATKYQMGVYYRGENAVKFVQNEKYSTKSGYFLRFLLYLCHVIDDFACLDLQH